MQLNHKNIINNDLIKHMKTKKAIKPTIYEGNS